MKIVHVPSICIDWVLPKYWKLTYIYLHLPLPSLPTCSPKRCSPKTSIAQLHPSRPGTTPPKTNEFVDPKKGGHFNRKYMGVEPKIGVKPPKSSILIGFSIIYHPFWGYPYSWKHPHLNQPLIFRGHSWVFGGENSTLWKASSILELKVNYHHRT